MEFEMVDQETAGKTIIKVVGVGGAGGNAVQHMIRRGVDGVEFICMNTDAGALQRSAASINLQLGSSGLGAGAKPESRCSVGRRSARSDCGFDYRVRTWYLSPPVWVAAQAPERRQLWRRSPKRWAY